MPWPQLIVLMLIAHGLGVKAANHIGPADYVSHVVIALLVLALLWWGGFFAPLMECR